MRIPGASKTKVAFGFFLWTGVGFVVALIGISAFAGSPGQAIPSILFPDSLTTPVADRLPVRVEEPEVFLTLVLSEACQFSSNEEVLANIRALVREAREWSEVRDVPLVVHAMIVAHDPRAGLAFLSRTSLRPDELTVGRSWFNDWASIRIWTEGLVHPVTPQVVVTKRIWSGHSVEGFERPPHPEPPEVIHRFRGVLDLQGWYRTRAILEQGLPSEHNPDQSIKTPGSDRVRGGT